MADSKKTSKNSKASEGEIVDDKALVVQAEKPKRGRPAGKAVAQRDSVLSIVGGVTTEQLTQALKVQTEQRNLINDFIKSHLKEGTDYGKIHVVKNCVDEDRKRGSCEKDYHFSKPILFKPGQEKIFSLFGITDELTKDLETYEMLPGVNGLVAYKCVMYRGDQRIGEGRGAATLAGERSDPNSVIKKAEKRARMDACLSLGFSEYFTQDLDDPEYESQRSMANTRAANEAERRDKDEFGLMPRDPDALIDNAERITLQRMLLAVGFSDPDEILEMLKLNGIANPAAMTSAQARQMMGKLKNSTFAAPEVEKPAEEPDEPPAPDLPAEPELVVDDELKNEVQNRASMIGLNARGVMWLMQRVAGKPFAKWEKLTDEEWRKAYSVVQGILDGQIDVDDSHIAGVISSDPDFPDPELPLEEDDQAVPANG